MLLVAISEKPSFYSQTKLFFIVKLFKQQYAELNTSASNMNDAGDMGELCGSKHNQRGQIFLSKTVSLLQTHLPHGYTTTGILDLREGTHHCAFAMANTDSPSRK